MAAPAKVQGRKLKSRAPRIIRPRERRTISIDQELDAQVFQLVEGRETYSAFVERALRAQVKGAES